MSSFLDKAKALGGKAVEATADAVEIGTLKAKIAARKGDIEKQYEALGEIIYENRSTLELNPEEDPEALKTELSEIREAMAGAFSEISRLDAEIAQRRPMAVMIPNNRNALPQYGVSLADVIYEAPMERCSCTRLMGIFQNYGDLEYVEPIRSARHSRIDIVFFMSFTSVSARKTRGTAPDM